MAVKVAVLGSVNVDWVVRVERPPRPGETIKALGLERFPGGKGANQAVAAARLGAATALYAKVGDDPFGRELLEGLRNDGVDVSAVEVATGTPTGTALIWVDARGENAIVIAAGANGLVDARYVDRVWSRIAEADVLLLQLEVPWAAIAHLLGRLPQGEPLVILDPAPADALPPLDSIRGALGRVDALTPNAVELAALTGISADAEGEEAIERGLRALEEMGLRVVCKAGERGAYFLLNGSGRLKRVPAFPVEAVDTTAAGDAFTAALGVALAEGKALEEAVRFANAAGALAVTRRGAQPSLPNREDVEALSRGA